MTASPPRAESERWLELSVEADVEAVEAVSEILGRVASGTVVRPTRLVRDPADELAVREDPAAPYIVTAHIPDDAAAPAALTATEQALWHLQAFGLRPVGELQVRAVAAADWSQAWRSGYRPQRIGRLVIVPSWLEEPIGPGEVAVQIDPGMAFGTGLHPTTRGCLALLQRVAPMPASVLDVGCGSGILSIAALRLGAGRAAACDTDPLAVAATLENAARNGVRDRISVARGSLDAVAAGRYPLVLANLVASLLVELAATLADRVAPGGSLIASGVLSPRGDEVAGALAGAGLRVAERIDDGEWLSLRAERPA